VSNSDRQAQPLPAAQLPTSVGRALVDRLEHPPGRAVQCGLRFPEPKIAVGFGQEAMLPVLVMVAAFSRFIATVMPPSRQIMDLVAGMRQLLSGSFAAVPHELWWDNEAGIGRRGRLTDPVSTALLRLADTNLTSELDLLVWV
jgi:hypothetical protein